MRVGQRPSTKYKVTCSPSCAVARRHRSTTAPSTTTVKSRVWLVSKKTTAGCVHVRSKIRKRLGVPWLLSYPSPTRASCRRRLPPQNLLCSTRFNPATVPIRNFPLAPKSFTVCISRRKKNRQSHSPSPEHHQIVRQDGCTEPHVRIHLAMVASSQSLFTSLQESLFTPLSFPHHALLNPLSCLLSTLK